MDLEEWSNEDLAKEVRKLRDENADRRTKMRDYEEVFGQFDDATARGLLSLVSNLAQDEKGAAVVLRDLAHDILGEEILKDAPWITNEETPEEEEEPDVADEALLQQIEEMKAELAALKEHKEQSEGARKAAEDAEVQKIVAEAEALGYKAGTKAFQHLMYVLINDDANEFDGDMVKAAKSIEGITKIKVAGDEPAEEQEDTFEEGDETEDGKRFPSTSKANAGAPGLKKADPPKTWEEAGDRVYEMLGSQPEV